MKQPHTPVDYIVPLDMNGLDGRMLRMPARQKSQPEILFIYGQHSSLERWWGVAQELNKFGAVTMPDLPGFGGMDSFFTIGKKPTLDNLADYLAAFIKLRYKRKRLIVIGMSFGFVVVTRMLQRYPEMTKKVDLLVSIVGFAHKDDFIFSRPKFIFYKIGSRFFSRRVPAWVFQHVFLQPAWLRVAYSHSPHAKQKFANKAGDEFKRTMDVEVELWQINDIRTQMVANAEMFSLDHCRQRVDLPLWHVEVANDRYFDGRIVEQHMRIIFSDFKRVKSGLDNHAPSIIADAKQAAPLIPPGLRRAFRQAISPAS